MFSSPVFGCETLVLPVEIVFVPGICAYLWVEIVIQEGIWAYSVEFVEVVRVYRDPLGAFGPPNPHFKVHLDFFLFLMGAVPPYPP